MNIDPATRPAELSTPRPTHALFAFGIAIPIGLLGGLIGLGGAEFRLPVLVGRLRYAARQAVPLNLAVSLVTVTFSLIGRARALPFEQLAPSWRPMPAPCSSIAYQTIGWSRSF